LNVSSSKNRASTELRFASGKNWQSFVRSAVSEERVATAAAALRRLCKRPDLLTPENLP